MKPAIFLCSIGAAIGLVTLSPVMAQARSGPGDAQGAVRRDMRAGAVRPLRDIEARILPTKPGMQYLGPEYDPTAMAYRLKFIHQGRVVFVDVDARTGDIIHH